MLNATKQCDCGKQKSAKVQFCSECWAKMPPVLQDRYKRAVEALQAAITGCRISAK